MDICVCTNSEDYHLYIRELINHEDKLIVI